MSMRKIGLAGLILITYPVMAVHKSPQLGYAANHTEVVAWSIGVFPDGTGLPEGAGTVAQGESVYNQQCSACHGPKGQGGSAEELAGAEHGLSGDEPDKTIGTYWPYATTLFDFTRRSMPLNAPGSLDNNEVYAVTAYLLYLSGIIEAKQVMNADSLPKVVMPNRNGFIGIKQ